MVGVGSIGTLLLSSNICKILLFSPGSVSSALVRSSITLATSVCASTMQSPLAFVVLHGCVSILSGTVPGARRSMGPDTQNLNIVYDIWRDLKALTLLQLCNTLNDDMDDLETFDQWKERLTEVIIQMMFVSGETVEASAETTGMIEEIVRQQVIEMVGQVSQPYLTVVWSCFV